MDTCGEVSPSVPMVFAEGDSYTIGSTIGTALYENMFSNASSSFPQYVDELQGMADAIGITLEEMVLWNLLFDWELLLSDETPVGMACSDIFLVQPMCTSLIGHTEDNYTHFKDLGYLGHACISDTSGSVIEEFFHYCYPGSLCGDAYGFNKGVVMTITSLLPSNACYKTKAIPRNFLSCACAGKTEPDGVWTTPINGYDYHLNMLRHSTPALLHRLARTKDLPVPTCSKDILGIQGDTADLLSEWCATRHIRHTLHSFI
ncbi:hypothetical protein EMCRGX_G015130 [Ephydatia muelleri]